MMMMMITTDNNNNNEFSKQQYQVKKFDKIMSIRLMKISGYGPVLKYYIIQNFVNPVLYDKNYTLPKILFFFLNTSEFLILSIFCTHFRHFQF